MKLVVSDAALGPALHYPLNGAFVGSYDSFVKHIGRRGTIRVKDRQGCVRASFDLEAFAMWGNTWWWCQAQAQTRAETQAHKAQAHKAQAHKAQESSQSPDQINQKSGTTAVLLVHAKDGRVVLKLLLKSLLSAAAQRAISGELEQI